MHFHRAKPGCEGFRCRRQRAAYRRHSYSSPAGRYRNPLNLLNLLNPLNPGPLGPPPLVAGATTFAPVGSVSLDFRVTTFPYKSSSLATPQAGAQQPVHNIEPHMILQPRGALLSHRSAGGRWCRKAPKGEKPPQAAPSRRLVFTAICLISGLYRDSSPAAQNDDEGGKGVP